MAPSDITLLGDESKLNQNNYGLWKFKMQTLLMIKNMWKIEMGEEPRPAHGDQRNDWDRRALQAQGLININVKDTLVGYIRSATSAKEAWDILARRFEGKSIIKVMHLKSKLNEATKSSSESVHEYLLKLRNIQDELAVIGEEVSDADMIQSILKGIKKEYKHFVTSLAVRESFPSLEDLTSLLLQEEERFVEDNPTSRNQPSALIMGQGERYNSRGGGRHGRGFHRNNNSRFAASSNSTPTHNTNQPFEGRRGHQYQGSRGRGNGRRIGNCYNCKIFGHWQRDCTRSPRTNGRSQITNGPSNNESIQPHDLHHDWFTSVQPFEGEGSVLTGDDSHHAIQGKGTITIQMSQGEEKDLSNVLLVPGITKNLISMGQIVEKDYEVKFNKDGCYVKNDKGKVVAHGEKNGRLFKLKMNATHNANFSSHSSSSFLILWHKRLGHIIHQSIMHLRKEGLVEGLPTFQVHEEPNLCPSCQFGKQQRRRFNKSTYRAKQPLELIHSDVWGPSQTTSMGGAHYFLTFVDDLSRKVWVYFLKNKSEVFSYFKQFKAMVEKECRRFIKTLRSNQGGEFKSKEFEELCWNQGIWRQYTCAYTPQQNGVAERKNRVIVEHARAMLNEGNLPKLYWAEAVNTSVHLMNMSPTKALTRLTPEEAYSGIKPNVSTLKVFGCVAYMHIPDEKRRKLDVKSERMPPNKSKKAPAFYTDQVSLVPFKVQAKDLIKTSLGLTASVVGIKHTSKEGEGETGLGTLWVDYRGGYRVPIEKDGFEKCFAPSRLWQTMHEFHQVVEADEAMRDKIQELNELFKLGLLDKDKKKK
ncbi:hypothetical protein L7F22_059818 [Adiantum nelumboides]|nr:hypothetical protein [Adiantum nelumboides]